MAVPRVLEVDALRYLERQQPFDGRPEDLPIFIANIEDIIPVLNSYNAAGQTMLINTIRSKLIGRARQIIEIHTHLNTWTAIKNLLVTNFSSFKSSQQLHEDLRSTTFKTNVLEFYNEIQHKLSTLNQKCKQENNLLDIVLNIQTALKTFKNNIGEPMKSILYARNPDTIERALHILSEGGYLYNRDRPYNNQTDNRNYFQNKTPQRQEQKMYNNHNRNFNNYNRNNYQHNNYAQHSNNYQHKPQNRPHNNFVPQNRPNNNFVPRPQYNNPQQNRNDRQRLLNNHNIPEPMDIDGSGQTRRNYYNELPQSENYNELPQTENYNEIPQTENLNENFPLPASHTNYHM